ncbi:MAG: hypothetical protein WCO58_01235 [bacterium]
MERFNFDANTKDEAVSYLHHRALQLLKFDVSLKEIIVKDECVIAIFEYDGKEYQAIYLLFDYRNKGLYPKIQQELNLPVLTSKECLVADYLEKKQIPYIEFELEDSVEYKLIAQYYGNQKAKRSGVYLINHIDEGLAILHWIGATTIAQRAYCLHPLLQSDEALIENYMTNYENIDPAVLIATMEYRSVANEYLSKRKIQSIDEIRLSPLKDVNDMLIADKIQNYKDFELYHLNTHERSDALVEYFENWLRRLGVQELYQEYKIRLQIK